jgi:hypothetical protein
MKATIVPLLILSSTLLLSLVSATPDCYDFSVTEKREDYMEFLPNMLYYGQVDWLKIQGGKNCAFYTYGDVFFQSYHSSVSGIYFVFRKTLGSTCKLENKL